MTAAVGVVAPEIKVGGAPLPTTWSQALTELRIERSLCLMARTTLRFADWGYQLSASSTFSLGTGVTIGIQGTGDILMAGVVTGISLEQTTSDNPELVVTVDDKAFNLTVGTRVKTYLTSSYADVVEQIAANNGLSAEVSSTALRTLHEYLLQSGSDIAFLQTVCERTGAVWWVDGTNLKVADVSSVTDTVNVSLGDTLADFSVRASALRPTSVSVAGWDPNAQQDVSGQSSPAVTTASSNFVSKYVGSAPQSLKASIQSSFDLNPEDADDAKRIASALNDSWSSSAVIARGRGLINPAIKLMIKVHVENAGPTSGDYVVSQVEHVYRQDGFYTRFVAGPIRPGGLVDTLGQTSPDPGFEIGGLLTALVTNLADPDNVGRVKVQYNAAGGTIESPWARVVGMGVGNGRGSVFQPEVNDEVLVGFERGDSRRPVVLGGLFSKKNVLPAGAAVVGSSQVDYRRIMSRLGHVIELADGSGPTTQHVLLQTASGHKMRLGADRFDIEVASGKPIAIKAGSAKFEIDEQSNVTIEGTKITLKATGQLSMEGQAGVEVKTTAKASVQGTMVEVKASGMGSVQADGPLTLKGAIVAIN